MPGRISRRALLRLAASVWLVGLAPALWPRRARAATLLPTGAGTVAGALGSLLYEEYRGDLARARRLAEQGLASARRKGAPAGLADALLVLGAVELLAGDAAAALGRFDEAEGLTPRDRDRALWARTYALAAFLAQYNTFPDGTSAEGDEIDRRRYGTAEIERSRLAEYLARQEQAAARASERARLECEAVKQVFHAGVLARDFASFGFEQRRAGPPNPMAAAAATQVLQVLGAAAEALDDDRLGAYVALVAADAYRRLGSAGEAEALLAAAREAYEAGSDDVGLAAARMLEGDWRAAPLTTPAVLNLALSASPNADSSLSWAVEEAELDRSRLDLERARLAYAEAERGFRRGSAPRGLAAIELRRAHLAMLEVDYPRALEACARAVQGFRASGDGLGLWCARIHQALARVGAGERPEDRETARALGAWGAGPGSFAHALGLGMLCSRAGRHWLLRAGDYERSLACHRLAEAVYGPLGATISQAQSLVDQGVVFREIGERAAALTLMRQAADRYRQAAQAGGPYAAPAAGRLVALLNDLFQAHAVARDADGMERVADELAALVEGLGGDPAAMADPMLAVRLAFQGRTVIAQAAATVPTLRGIEARDRGESARAEDEFARALAAARATDPNVADPDFLEAIVHRARKDHAAAERSFGRYLERLTGAGGPDDALLALMRQLDPGRAAGEVRKQEARAHEQALAFYVTIEAYPAARAHLQALEAAGGESWWQATDSPWQTLADIGLVHEGLGEHGQAARRYQQAIELLEGRRERLRRDELKTAIASGLGPQYLYFQAARNAVDAAAAAAAAGRRDEQQALLAEGFGYAERGKARGLLDLMAGAVPGDSETPTSAAVRAWREASARVSTWRGLLAAERGRSAPEAARIAYLDERIAAEEERLRRVETDLAGSDPAFHQAVSARGSVLDLAGVTARLPEGTALLQIAFLGDDLLAWAVSRHGLVQAHRATVDAKALERQIRTLHRRCETRAPLEDAAAPLARALLEPLAAAIDGHPDLLIVPYGAAHLLPFHALPWRGEPLAASHTVAYLPSASTLQFVRPGGGGPLSGRLLAVGDPAAMAYTPPLGAPPQPQPALPAAAVEAVQVAALFPQGRALTGEEATVEAVRAAIPGYRLLHFATHGHLSEDVPLLSAILLANGGALTVYDLVGLQLDADLVVLSACRTGQGAATGGDDVLGLTRGLLAAGARAAVVSLWPVDDLATSLLMERFYRELRAGRGAAAALQAAQAYLRGLGPDQVRHESRRVAETARGVVLGRATARAGDEEARPYAHPYYWAPFVLVG